MTTTLRSGLALVVALFFALSSAESQTTVTLTPVADASIDYLSGDANLGAADTLEVGYLSSRYIRRALIRFNLAAAVPADATIDSAQLKLYLEIAQDADPANFLAVLIAEDWSESQVTWNNQPNRDQPTIGVSMNSVLGYKSIDVTLIVQAWHNAPQYGLELRGGESDPTYRRVFSSRENVATPPQLVVTYHLPAAPTSTPTATRTRTPTRTATPTSTLTPGNCVELLMNGGFEDGGLLHWQASGARLGSGRNSAAGVEFLGADNAVDQVAQNVGIPAQATSAQLTFWWLAAGGVDQPNDILIAFASHQTGATELKTLHAVAPFEQWQHETLDVTSYAGQLEGIAFTAYSDGAQPSTFRLDDVSLMACGVPTAPPTRTATRTPTPTATATVTRTPTPTRTPTRTATASFSATVTRTHTATPTPSATRTPTKSTTPTATPTSTAITQLLQFLGSVYTHEPGVPLQSAADVQLTLYGGPMSGALETVLVTAVTDQNGSYRLSWGGDPHAFAVYAIVITDTRYDVVDATPAGIGQRVGDTIEYDHPPLDTYPGNDFVVSEVPTPSPSPTVTSTALPTLTPTPTHVPTTTRTPTPTHLATSTPTAPFVPTLTPTPTFDSNPPPLQLIISGIVILQQPGEPQRPLWGTPVGLYGAYDPTEPGALVATATTGRSGTFRFVALTHVGAGFPYYVVGVDDPNYVIVGAYPGTGGEVDGQRIRVAAIAQGQRSGNEFAVRRADAAPILKVAPNLVPMFDSPGGTPEPGPPVTDLSILGIELTQATQCFDQSAGYKDCPDNSLELTRGKPIAARVYVGHTGGAPCPPQQPVSSVLTGVTVTLSWTAANANFPAGTWLGDSAVQQFDVPCSTTIADLRDDERGAATFILPAPLGGAGWKNVLWADAEVSSSAITESNTANNAKEVSAQLFDRQPLHVQWTLVDYRPLPATMSAPYTGPAFACDLNDMPNCSAPKASGLMAQMYPMPIAYTMAPAYLIFGSIPSIPTYCNDCADVRDKPRPLLEKLDAMQAWLQPQPDVLIGWLPKEAQGCGGVGWPTTAWISLCDFAGSNEEILAHETGHTQHLLHMDANEDEDRREKCWPFPGDNGIAETGLSLGSKYTYRALTYDFMSASSSGWISPFTWNKLIGKPLSKEWALVGPYCAPASSALRYEAPATPRLAGALASDTPQAAVLVRGTVDEAEGEMAPLYQFMSRGPFTVADPAGEYAIEFQTADGATLATHTFTPKAAVVEADSAGGAATDTVPQSFSLLLPFPSSARRVVLRHGASVLTERTASPAAPTISIVAPLGGTISGEVAIAWDAQDDDGDALQFAVLYSPDDGASWVPLALDIDGDSVTVDSTWWAGGEQARVRVVATDGFNSAAADSPPFSVPRKAPNAWITAPENGVQLLPEEAALLNGHAEDREEGELTGDSLMWRSDRQGPLGTGAQLIIPPLVLVPGPHVITLTATDSDGQTAAATIGLTVAACAGDCNLNAEVTIDELLVMVNAALGSMQLQACLAGDVNADGEITINEIITAVNNGLNGCGNPHP